MWTVNFEFYRSTYGGAMEAESFPQAIRAACAYIDTLTFGRLRGAEEIPDDVQLARDFAQHRIDVAEIYLPRAHPLRYAGIR